MKRSAYTVLGLLGVVVLAMVAATSACSNTAEDCELIYSCTTSAGSAGTGGSAGSGGTAEQDCTNGLDDDGDGNIDCDDTDCEPGYGCVPALPTDTLVVMASSQSCEAGTTDLGWLDCSACPCDVTPGTCAIDFQFATMANCNMSSGFVIDETTPMGCTDAVFTNMGGVYVKITNVLPTVPSTASCGVLPTEVSACQIDKVGSCTAAGNVCAPKTLGPVCMVVADGASCPAEYPNAITLQEGGDCGCQCDETCPVSISLYGEAGCMGTATDFSGTLNQCAQSSIDNIMSAKAPPSDVTCSGTPMPTGGTPKTLCCLM